MFTDSKYNESKKLKELLSWNLLKTEQENTGTNVIFIKYSLKVM